MLYTRCDEQSQTQGHNSDVSSLHQMWRRIFLPLIHPHLECGESLAKLDDDFFYGIEVGLPG